MHDASVGAPTSISAALDCFTFFRQVSSFSYSFNYSRSEIVKRFCQLKGSWKLHLKGESYNDCVTKGNFTLLCILNRAHS
jgi:hypothetical protein